MSQTPAPEGVKIAFVAIAVLPVGSYNFVSCDKSPIVEDEFSFFVVVNE